ncbi:MAG: hypothetical protein A2521_10040 [Deltaproteobacteria bacterium RIFOXYD12_FULL_57_12]|nr:MAG: hypothetical protein A2521_10040 [Deltaproteobacteria bacterium RIFOXYD12_FULL_57_12]
MTMQFSFTKQEHEILPEFRQKINISESTADVKKFFVYTVTSLFDKVFAGEIDFGYEDIALMPGSDPPYRVASRLLDSTAVSPVWKNSDLPQVIERLAKTAMNRYNHLEKKPEKTDAKIRRKQA